MPTRSPNKNRRSPVRASCNRREERGGTLAFGGVGDFGEGGSEVLLPERRFRKEESTL